MAKTNSPWRKERYHIKCCNGCIPPKRYPGCGGKCKEYKEEKEEQGYGSIRIRDDLLKKKRISLDIVDSLSFQNEEEKAKAIALSMEKRLETYPLKQKREKAISSLLRRGFPMETCLEAVSSFQENKEESRKRLERDYSLLRKRYEKKYSGYAYRQHLSEGLLRRGYNKEDIQGIMEDLTINKSSKN